MEAIEQLRKDVNDGFNTLYGKLDAIIQRNAAADSNIAVLQNKIDSHSHEDEKTFKAIKDKHAWYDKVIIGALVFASTELFAIVVYLAIHKEPL